MFIRDSIHQPENSRLILVTMPTVTTEDTLTVDLAEYGLDETNYADGEAEIIRMEIANGTVGVNNDTVVINSTGKLVITEGARGFVTGDVFLIAATAHRILNLNTGTASTA